MGNIQLKGSLRFALYFRGQKSTIPTGRIVDGDKEVREVEKAKVIYGDWVGGSYYPVKKYSEVVGDAVRVEIHRKNLSGATEVLWWEENPQEVTIEWLAFTGTTPESISKGQKLPTFIRGMRVNSPVHGLKEFIVVEGV